MSFSRELLFLIIAESFSADSSSFGLILFPLSWKIFSFSRPPACLYIHSELWKTSKTKILVLAETPSLKYSFFDWNGRLDRYRTFLGQICFFCVKKNSLVSEAEIIFFSPFLFFLLSYVVVLDNFEFTMMSVKSILLRSPYQTE